MLKIDLKLMTAVALASALMAGCGGDSSGDSPGDGGGNGGVDPGTPVQQTITNVADYVRNLIASAGGNTEPIDVNGLKLVPNDTAAPAAVN